MVKKKIDTKLFGERLSRLIDNGSETTYSMAERLSLSASTISRYANGLMEPKITTLYALASYFKVNPLWLMGVDGEPMYEGQPGGSLDQAPEKHKRRGVNIPVLGRVPAGIPIEAIEDVIGWEEIPEKMAASGEYFGLRVKGDSMTPTILDGDIVIVRRQPGCESGEVAIVTINECDATLKRLKKTPDGVMLIANNPAYTPKYYSCDDIENLPVKVVGKVVELRRKL